MGKDLNIDNLKGINFPFEIYKDGRSVSMDEWLVSKKTCQGCKYFGHISPGYKSSNWCCDYTFATGKIRQNKPAECEVKVLSEKKAGAEVYKRCLRKFNIGRKNCRAVESDG